MAVEINDYFIPGFIEHELKMEGRFKLEHRFFEGNNDILINHLNIDGKVIEIIGKSLRRRRNTLLKNTDLLESNSVKTRLKGFFSLFQDLRNKESALRKEIGSILPEISGFSCKMIEILLNSMLAGREYETEFLSANVFLEACSEFTRIKSGYIRFYTFIPKIFLKAFFNLNPAYRLSGIGFHKIPEVITNICAGNAPGIPIMKAFLAAVIGASSFGKNSSAEPFFGPRFFSKLADIEKKNNLFPLSDTIALITFKGAEPGLIKELIRRGDHIQVTGGIDSRKSITRIARSLRLRSIRDFRRRVSGHWHKISFDVIGGEFIKEGLDTVAFNVAFDNSMFETQGCLSAQQVFVEGNTDDVLKFAGKYIEHMRILLDKLPKGARPGERLKDMYYHYESKPGIKILTSLKDLDKYNFFAACEFEPDGITVYNALNRSIIIRRLENLENDLPRILESGMRRELLQSCGIAVSGERLIKIAGILGRAGVNRIVPAGDIWNMRLGAYESWDGYLPPADLIFPQYGYWTTVSFQDINTELEKIRRRNEGLLVS